QPAAEAGLAGAMASAGTLGAKPLAKHVTLRLRELGLRVPRGPREATRANPAGLTARQLEVLALVVEGLSNTEIADRLVVSPRTAEHHVTAVLAKLGASSRHEAARRAAELQLMPRSEPQPPRGALGSKPWPPSGESLERLTAPSPSNGRRPCAARLANLQPPARTRSRLERLTATHARQEEGPNRRRRPLAVPGARRR